MPAYAPTITIEAAMELPSAAAVSVAGTSNDPIGDPVDLALEQRRVDQHDTAPERSLGAIGSSICGA